VGNASVVGVDEAKLWSMADALRNNMDAAEYKHVVLGLIFLKYISDAFEARYEYLRAAVDDPTDEYFLRPDLPNRREAVARLLEDQDEYKAVSIFWVPKEARWAHLKGNAPQPKIGTIVDDAMAAIERDNPSLKGVLPKDYARPGLDKQRLGQLINLVSDIGLGTPAARAKDIRVLFCFEAAWMREVRGNLRDSYRRSAPKISRSPSFARQAASVAPSSIACAAPCAMNGNIAWQASPSSVTRPSDQRAIGVRSKSPQTSKGI
jgi:type I restriction-modification system DNA methylase subunit